MAAYVVMFFGIPRSAEKLETITRWPELWARKIWAAASVWASAPMKLVSRRREVGVEAAGAQRLALAEAGVDDHLVETAELLAELLEDAEDGVVVSDVERLDRHRDLGVGGGDLGPEVVEAVRTSGAQGEVVAQGGELAGHLGAEAAAGTGDEDRRHGGAS